MPFIERHIRIDAPIVDVWEILVDIPGQPRWMRDLRAIEFQERGPVGVGTVAIGTVHMFGLRQADPIEITALDRPTHYAIRHLGAFRGWGEFRLRPVADGAGTHLRWREELRPTPDALPFVARLARLPLLGASIERAAGILVRVADPLLVPVFHAVFRADLRRLKRLIETGRT